MPNKTTNDEDILTMLQDMMQLNAEGFNGLNTRIDSLQARMTALERQYSELKSVVDRIAGEQIAQGNDIKEILNRLLAIEKRLPNITEAELREMQTKLQQVVDWAMQIADKEHIALKVS